METLPGAGGGGAGAEGDGAKAGDGGGGGEYVCAHIDMQRLVAAGFSHMEFEVGNGGAGATQPGQHGEDGEDTIVKFVARDGSILDIIRARGGTGGKSGGACPEGYTEVQPADVRGGFRVTSLVPVNSAEFRDGLIFLLGGNWRKFFVDVLPTDMKWAIYCAVDWDDLPDGSSRCLFLSIHDPEGVERACTNLLLKSDRCGAKTEAWIGLLGAKFDQEGAWKLDIRSGGLVLASINVQVLLRD